MSPIQLLPILVLFAAAPAFAQEPDPHAGHNQPPAAAPAQPDAKGCPMHRMKVAETQAPQAGRGPMMMDKDQMHCTEHKAANAPTRRPTPKPRPKATK